MGRLDIKAEYGKPIMPLVFKIGLGIWMAAVIVAAFMYLAPAEGFTGQSARIVVFHVPMAMLSVVAYITSTVYAVIYLVRGREQSDIKSAISAGLGFLFTALATLTGMVFAQVQWGAAWNNDPRETSILMLLFVYAAYFALRGAIPAGRPRGKISAVYNIMACIVMPYLVFVLPRMLGGLHPSDTLANRQSLSMDYKLVMGCSMVCFLMLYVWLFRLHVRISEIIRSRRRLKRV